MKKMINNGIKIKAIRKNWSVNEILEEAELVSKRIFQLIMNDREGQVCTRLEFFPTEIHINYEKLEENGNEYRKLRKTYHDRRHRAKTHTIKCGDTVVIKRERKRKERTPYERMCILLRKYEDQRFMLDE